MWEPLRYRDALRDRTVQFVVGVTIVGLVARFVFLGTRISHFDEARVAWWGLHYAETGTVQYHYIIHGPFLQHVHRPLFTVFGATDFVARAPVALVSGLLPLVALWFRHRLSDLETCGLAFLLALDPIILYYSRFTRSVLLVAGFCLVAFAAFVRWYDGFGYRYLYLGAAFLALGFAAKENALVYVLCWLGAGALLLDAALFRPRAHESGRAYVASTVERVRSAYRRDPARVRTRLRTTGTHAIGAAVVFLLVIVFFFAPRGGETGLYSGDFVATLSRTVADVDAGYDYWFGQSEEKTVTTYFEWLGRFGGTALAYSVPLVVLSIVGFLVERYGRAEPRPLVLASAYWGVASAVGYPLGADIWGPWIIVNALVPLAIPAAVGLSHLLLVGRRALGERDYASAGAAAVLLGSLVVTMGVVGIGGVYVAPTEPDNELVQYAQPDQQMRPAVDEAMRVASANDDGHDILFYGGEDFVTMDEDATRTPACIDWFSTLPWAWYLDANGASVTCADGPDRIPARLPPVVVAEADCTLDRAVECRSNPDALHPDPALQDEVPDSYERYGFLHRTTGGNDFEGMVVYVDADRDSER